MALKKLKIAGATLTLTTMLSLPIHACPPEQHNQANYAYGLATEFLQTRDWEMAIPSLESAIQICSDHELSLKWLGKSYLNTGQYNEAKETMENLIEVRGSKAEASDYMDLGKIYAKLKDFRNARQAMNMAHQIDPNNCVIMFNLGILNGAVNDYTHQVEIFEKAYNQCGENQEMVLSELIKACKNAEEKERSMGNNAQAEIYEDKYVMYAKMDSGQEGYKLIIRTIEQGDFSEAITLSKEFLKNNPDHHPAWLSMARCQTHLGLYSGAISSYESYLELKPEDHEATGKMIEIYAQSELCEEGIVLSQEASNRFIGVGMENLAEIYYGWGKNLECTEQYMEAKEKFRIVTMGNNSELARIARLEMDRQDQLEEIRQLKLQNAGY